MEGKSGAVVPAPIAYIKVFADKTLVVGYRSMLTGPIFADAVRVSSFPGTYCAGLDCLRTSAGRTFTVKKLGFSKQAFAMNTLAWNNRTGLDLYCLGSREQVMIKRSSWGHTYFIVRGEILGLIEEKQLRKHLPRMFSLIKNESKVIENDQVPSWS